jgi:hypothetical protein
MATSYHQLGILATKTANLSRAIEHLIAALAIRQRIEDSRTVHTITELARTRSVLPDDEFNAAARNVLDEGNITNLHQLLDTYDTAQNAEAPGDTGPSVGGK